MNRYIDADAFIEYLKNEARLMEEDGASTMAVMIANGVINDVKRQPSIDIVRCKECKHNYNKTLNHGKMYPRCDFTDRKLSENDYCSRGEREGE